ncbi:hypothetical protein FB567DRAFT_194061 [Paraphoma chrysanthemicola]|uniref:Heterokaryon incompatibility domain-containing protein n=1 Tax=Paraphoma chrysanthemicola TaxID=798071 RepID=A0A8K0QUE3_9PLEO|nr:hypothetical protein FB567DRAFT_194061 [Paraphoma chrysanthemicola]
MSVLPSTFLTTRAHGFSKPLGRFNKSQLRRQRLAHAILPMTLGNIYRMLRMLDLRSNMSIPTTSEFESIYDSLPGGARYIRLLEIEGNDDEGEISCKLRSTCLDDKPSFLALSYTWGDPNQTQTIFLTMLGTISLLGTSG